MTLVERHGVACAASGKSGGFIARDWCDGQLQAELARASFDLHAELARTLDADYGYKRIDTLLVAGSDRGDIGRYRGLASPEWLDGHCVVHSRHRLAAHHRHDRSGTIPPRPCRRGMRARRPTRQRGRGRNCARCARCGARSADRRHRNRGGVGSDRNGSMVDPCREMAAAPASGRAQGLQRSARTPHPVPRARTVRRIRECIRPALLTRNRGPGARRGVGLRPILR